MLKFLKNAVIFLTRKPVVVAPQPQPAILAPVKLSPQELAREFSDAIKILLIEATVDQPLRDSFFKTLEKLYPNAQITRSAPNDALDKLPNIDFDFLAVTLQNGRRSVQENRALSHFVSHADLPKKFPIIALTEGAAESLIDATRLVGTRLALIYIDPKQININFLRTHINRQVARYKAMLGGQTIHFPFVRENYSTTFCAKVNTAQIIPFSAMR